MILTNNTDVGNYTAKSKASRPTRSVAVEHPRRSDAAQRRGSLKERSGPRTYNCTGQVLPTIQVIVKSTMVFFAACDCYACQSRNCESAGCSQQKVWPEALSLSQRAGSNALFRGLRSALESDCVSLKGVRKHKRPEYYTPSL